MSLSSTIIYLDESFNFHVSVGSFLDQNLFLKASTAFGKQPAFLPVKISVNIESKISSLLNKAPYFEKQPDDVELILNQTSQNFEITLPKVIDDQGDEFTIEAENLPKQLSLSEGKILLKDITNEGTFLVNLVLKD